MSWEELRSEARSIERRLEAGIQRYASVTLDLEDPKTNDEDEKAEAEIEAWLTRMGDLIQALDGCSVSGRSANKAQIQRLREILFDYKMEFRKAQQRKTEKRQSMLLVKEVNKANREEMMAESALLEEMHSLDQSQQATDAIMNQAQAVKETLRKQRLTISGATSRLASIGRSVPGVEQLIKRIQDKRTRDNTILAIVIALCLCFLLWYWLRSWGL